MKPKHEGSSSSGPRSSEFAGVLYALPLAKQYRIREILSERLRDLRLGLEVQDPSQMDRTHRLAFSPEMMEAVYRLNEIESKKWTQAQQRQIRERPYVGDDFDHHEPPPMCAESWDELTEEERQWMRVLLELQLLSRNDASRDPKMSKYMQELVIKYRRVDEHRLYNVMRDREAIFAAHGLKL